MSNPKELEDVKKIFLDDNEVDEETRAANLQKITEWESTIVANENYAGWQDHDISKEISKQAKEAYKDFSMQLANNRNLTQAQRDALFAKQDAIKWLLSIIDKGDPKEVIQQTLKEIRSALSST